MKVTKAKGYTFEGFDCAVDAFGKAVRPREVKGIEDVRLPVSKHTQTDLKLRDLEPQRTESKVGKRRR